MTQYNKLVRNRIPEIIRADGAEPITRVLDDQEYREALVSKLGEEYEEFKAEPSLEELADIHEVLGAIGVAFGFSPEEVEAIRQKKAIERGGFDDRIFLEQIQ